MDGVLSGEMGLGGLRAGGARDSRHKKEKHHSFRHGSSGNRVVSSCGGRNPSDALFASGARLTDNRQPASLDGTPRVHSGEIGPGMGKGDGMTGAVRHQAAAARSMRAASLRSLVSNVVTRKTSSEPTPARTR